MRFALLEVYSKFCGKFYLVLLHPIQIPHKIFLKAYHYRNVLLGES